MADTKVSALTELATPAGTDVLYIVDDPGGSPLSRKITVDNLLQFMLALAEILDEDNMVSNSATYPPSQQSTKAYVDTGLALKLALAGGTMSGTLALADNLITRPVIKDYGETLVTDTDSGATHTINMEDGSVHALTLTANCTLTFSNPPATGTCGSFTLILTQDGTGSRTVTWPAAVDWASAAAPTLTTTASGVDILTFFTLDAGTRWYGFVSGQAMG